MMKNDLTELVFILDRSGSMGGLESDTIGGYNSLLQKQKDEGGEALITTVLFDNKYELLHDRINLKDIEPITDREYYVRGSTALLDAIGSTINKIGNVQKHIAEEERAEHVMFVITTDGMENASREFTYGKVCQMIEHQKDKYGWEFIFLGANIDAISVAKSIGINHDRAVKFKADNKGISMNYSVISEAVSSLRKGDALDGTWKASIEDDYNERD